MLVDGVSGHFGDVLRRLGLDIKSDKRVCHKVVDRLEHLLPDKVLPVIEQSVVEGLVSKPGLRYVDEDMVEYRGSKDEAGSSSGCIEVNKVKSEQELGSG